MNNCELQQLAEDLTNRYREIERRLIELDISENTIKLESSIHALKDILDLEMYKDLTIDDIF